MKSLHSLLAPTKTKIHCLASYVTSKYYTDALISTFMPLSSAKPRFRGFRVTGRHRVRSHGDIQQRNLQKS